MTDKQETPKYANDADLTKEQWDAVLARHKTGVLTKNEMDWIAYRTFIPINRGMGAHALDLIEATQEDSSPSAKALETGGQPSTFNPYLT